MPTTDNFFNRQARKLMRRPVRKAAALTTTTLEDRVVPSISGFAFQDYNANGKFDTGGTIPNLGGTNVAPPPGAPGSVSTAIDIPFGGLTVRVFDAAGTLVDKLTTDAVTGKWTSNAATGTNNYRVEYSGFPANFFPGPHGVNNGTTTQFVANGATNASLGVVRAQDYSPNNPILVTQVYTYGSAVGNSQPSLISFGYNAGASGTDPGTVGGIDSNLPSFHDLSIPTSQVGSTWGIGLNRQQQDVYAAAFTKRHVGWGPGGPAAIYTMNAPTQTAGTVSNVTTASTWINLQGLNASYNGGTLNLNVLGTFSAWAATRQLPGNQNQAYFEQDGGQEGWNAVGRTGLGGLTVSDDGNFVYVMNLAQKVLVEIPVNADGTANVAGVRAFDIPTITGVIADNIQAFGVEYHNGRVYVGLVNSAESTQNRADLRGFVYQFNPATGTFGNRSVVNDGTLVVNNGVAVGTAGTDENGFRLDYERGNGYGGSENFLPWSPVFITNSTSGTGASVNSPRAVKYPQAMLTGFSFDNNDNIILNLRDRVGDQVGSSIPDSPTDGLFYEAISAGDILKAFIDTTPVSGTVWLMERNGSSPAGADFPGTGVSGSVTAFGGTFTYGPNDGEGPAANPLIPTTGKAGANPGGEFFGTDLFAGSHQDTAIGSSVHVPGFPDVVSSHFDAVIAGNVRTSGVRWLNTANGTYVKAYEIYGQDQGGRGVYGSTFGKANGQGDLIAVTEPPPIEIGNRIFQDTNRNGIQDANEAGIDGVIVDLLSADGLTVIGSVTTAEGGQYYFNSGADPDAANNKGNAAYALGALVAGKNYLVRVPNAAGGTQQSKLNGLIATKFNVLTDAYLGDTEQQTRNSDVQIVGTAGIMNVSTGALGQSVHTFDAGFAPGVSLGDFVWNDVNNNGVFDSATETGIEAIPVRLYTDADGNGVPDNATPDFNTATDKNGNYIFNGLAPGKYVVEITSPAGFRSSTGNAFDPVVGPFESALVGNSTNNNEDHGRTVSGDIFTGFIVRTNSVTLGNVGDPSNPDNGGNANLRQDFGLYQTYSLGNRIWNDKNNDGLFNNAEVGVDGVTVRLFGLTSFDANGNLIGGSTPLTTFTTTANGGFYRFDNLIAGKYVVVVTGKAGPLVNLVSSTGGTSATVTFEPTPATQPPASKLDNRDEGTTDNGNFVRTGVITLGPGSNAPTGETNLVPPGGLVAQGNLDNQADMTNDFGFYEPLSLGNQIFNDANNNGVLDAGEVGIDGVSVSVFRSDAGGNPIGAALETQSTKNAGFYLFTGLGTDSYVVRVNSTTLPAGYWLSSSGKNGSLSGPFEPGADLSTILTDSVDRGTVLNATTVTSAVISISPNNAPAAGGTPGFTDTPDPLDSYRIVDFGFYQPISLGNQIWNDLNNDGKLNGLEVGVDGVPVNLYFDTDKSGTFNAAFDELIGSTTTKVGGFYLFQNLSAGGYFVEIAPTGFVSSTGTPSSPTGPYEPGITAFTNNEDHGTQAGAVIRSGLVTLVAGANTGGADIVGITDPTPQANRNYTIDFGIFQTLSVGNLVWNDLNNNGKFDAATEKGIDGVSVDLLDGLGNKLFTQLTSAGGSYLFSDLSAGTYSVRITAPAGFISSTGKVGGTANPYEPGIVGNQDNEDHGTQGTPFITAAAFVLAPAGGANPDGGTANLRQDFGLFQPLSLGNFVWGDFNNDGKFNGTETGLAGATVTLTDSKGAIIGTQITVAGGAYLFTNLVPDAYTVTVTPPANYISSTGSNGKATGAYEPGVTGTQDNEDHGTQSGANAVTTVTLAAPGSAANPDSTGFANLRQDFGFFQPLSLGNFVFNDVNNNGLFDGTDTKLANVPVTLLDSTGTAVGVTLTTDANGNYLFTNLLPGDYTIRITPPAGFVTSTGTNGSLTGPFEPGVTDTTDNADHGSKSAVAGFVDAKVTLAAPGNAANPDGGFANLRQDFGLFQPLSLGSFVWIDSNQNGNFDNGEPALSNVPVTLFDGSGTKIGTVVTDAKGSYNFTNLTPGSYYVSIVPPAGVLPSKVTATPLTSTDQQNVGASDPNNAGAIISPTVNLTLGGGPLVGGNIDQNAYVTFDFGLLALSKLSGFTYVDGNLDGKFTPGTGGDKAIPGVTVTLTGVDPNGKALPIQSAVTDKTGFYQFIDLLPGTYTITETQPNGFYTAFDTPGPLGGSSPGTNVVTVTPLVANQDAPQNNFGEFLPRMEFGYVWVDTNRNCVRDIGEAGLAGVPITIAGIAFAGTPFARPLVGSDLPGGSLTIITDATGYYAFPMLPPGTYSIARGDLLPSQQALFANWCLQLGDPNPNPGTAGNNIFTGVSLTTPIIRGPYNFGVIPINPNDPSKRNFLGSSANNPNTPNPNLAPPGGPTTGPIQYNPAFTTTTGNPAVSANVVVGTGLGQRALVRVLDFGTGYERLRFEPYGDYTGSVRVAQGDVDGDGVQDIIVGTGQGGGPRVRVFSGKDGSQLKDFFAYEPEFRNGIFVAAGDTNGDGKAEIITGTDAGGGPRVTVFDAVTGVKIQDFFAFDSSLRGGVRVAVADLNADGKADIVTTTGAGTATRVRVFNGTNPAAAPLQDFFAFGSTFTLGATLGVGDINGDGVKDIIVGTEAGGGPRVQVYDGANAGVVLKDFFAFESGLRSGVRVAAQDIDGDGKAEIVVSAANTGAARVRILRATDFTALEDFFALHVDFRGGAYVG